MGQLDKWVIDYHEHVEGCKQCAQPTSGLCETGQRLFLLMQHVKNNINAVYGKIGGRVEELKKQPDEIHVHDVKSDYPKP